MNRFLFFAFSLTAVTSAYSATISLESIPNQLRKNNPDLAAARLGIEEAKGRLLGAGRLSNPELGFELTHDRRFNEGTVGLSLDQKFPLTSRLKLEKKLSQQLVEAAALEVADIERKLITEAQTLAVKLLSLEQQNVLLKQQSQLAEKFTTFTQKRAAQGELSTLDTAQARLDSQRLLIENRKLELERVMLLGELKPKLGITANEKLNVTGQLPPIRNSSNVKAWEKRADYQLAKLKEDASRTSVDLARSKKWEDLSAGFTWEGERMEDAPDGLERTGFFGLRLSLPLPFWNRNQGEIAEKNASALRANLETKALAKLISNEASAALEEMKANASLVNETEDKLLPLVLEQTQLLEKAYESGQAELLTVLRAREQRLQLQSTVLEATKNYHLARVRYEAATRPASDSNLSK